MSKVRECAKMNYFRKCNLEKKKKSNNKQCLCQKNTKWSTGKSKTFKLSDIDWESHSNQKFLSVVGMVYHNPWHRSSTVSPCYQTYSQSIHSLQDSDILAKASGSVFGVCNWLKWVPVGWFLSLYTHCKDSCGGFFFEAVEGALLWLGGLEGDHTDTWAQR